MIYVPGTVLSTLHALSTYSSPQPYQEGTSTLILALKMKKLGLKEVKLSACSPTVNTGRAGFDPTWSDSTANGSSPLCGLPWRRVQ